MTKETLPSGCDVEGVKNQLESAQADRIKALEAELKSRLEQKESKP